MFINHYKFIHLLKDPANAKILSIYIDHNKSLIQLRVKKCLEKSYTERSSLESMRKNVPMKLWMFNRHVCMLTRKEMLLPDSLKVRIYKPVCLLTAIEILLQDDLKVGIYDRAICLLTAIEMLLQDRNLKRQIYDRSACLLIGFKLLLQERKNTIKKKKTAYKKY